MGGRKLSFVGFLVSRVSTCEGPELERVTLPAFGGGGQVANSNPLGTRGLGGEQAINSVPLGFPGVAFGGRQAGFQGSWVRRGHSAVLPANPGPTVIIMNEFAATILTARYTNFRYL